jgi:hypothetical protein
MTGSGNLGTSREQNGAMPIRIIKHEAVPQFYLRRLTLLRTRTKCFDPFGFFWLSRLPFVPRNPVPC